MHIIAWTILLEFLKLFGISGIWTARPNAHRGAEKGLSPRGNFMFEKSLNSEFIDEVDKREANR